MINVFAHAILGGFLGFGIVASAFLIYDWTHRLRAWRDAKHAETEALKATFNARRAAWLADAWIVRIVFVDAKPETIVYRCSGVPPTWERVDDRFAYAGFESAESRAKRLTIKSLSNGVQLKDTYYPAHRIHQITVTQQKGAA